MEGLSKIPTQITYSQIMIRNGKTDNNNQHRILMK